MSTSKQVYEQISDDQHQQQQYIQQQSQQAIIIKQLSNNHNSTNYNNSTKYTQQYNIQYQKTEQQQILEKTKSQKIGYLDNQQLGKYANYEEDQQDGDNINISITKTQKKGGLITAYYVYSIQGTDQRGNFKVPRRFNQFFQMRQAMVARWPGCFVPSIPAKNMLLKNDQNIIQRRKRYLNDFVKKMAKLPHLFYGQEFQMLLRSQQNDISNIFTKWPQPSSQSIINKYRINFSQLAGKQLNYDTNQKISDFIGLIKKNQSFLQKDRDQMKKLAQSNDKLNSCYNELFTKVFPSYQKTCLLQYCNKNQKQLLYLDQTEVKLQQHDTIVLQATKNNPYWKLYDMIRHQQRDGLAFIQAFQAKNKYQLKKHNMEIKICQFQKVLHQISTYKKSANNKNNQQTKNKLEGQIEELKKEKQNLLIMEDIVAALVIYIQIERYKTEKRIFYVKAMSRISSNGINSIQALGQVWSGLRDATGQKKKLIK